MLKFFCKIIKILYKYNMPKYIINFLIKICLINIFTIKIFSQNCCDECFKNCKKILCKKNDDNSNSNNNSDFDNNLDLNNKNDNSNLNNKNDNSNLNNNLDLDNNQEEYFKSLLEDFDKNIKNFNNSIFSENLDSTEAEYTIVTDGTTNNNGILGQGSYGTVYKVKNKKGKYFALKRVFIDERYEFSIKKEIQALIKCRDCKNVIKIFDAYKNPSKNTLNPTTNGYYYYIVTELYEGGDLQGFIKKCKNNITGLNNNQIREKKEIYIYQMINAVKQIHAKGIIHRDIKPANFFIGENDKLYLGDFGTATEDYDGKFLNGTPFYMFFFLNYMIGFMSGNKKIVNVLLKHCDLYSLMCLIFEVLEGTTFADYSGNSFVSYQNILLNKNYEDLCPKADFKVTDDVINKIISAQENLWQQIQNNKIVQQNNCMNFFFQQQLMKLMAEENILNLNLNLFSFSPILRWKNYQSTKGINVNINMYANMLNEIIINLFKTDFNIVSVMGTACYKNLDNLYKKNY